MDKNELDETDLRKKHISIFMTIWATVMVGLVIAAFLEWWPHSTFFLGFGGGIVIAIRGAVLGLWRWGDVWHDRHRNSA